MCIRDSLYTLAQTIAGSPCRCKAACHHQQNKLLAAEARQVVILAQCVLQLPCHRLQHAVAYEVAMCVVDTFEVIDIHHNQQEWGNATRAAGDLALQRVGEMVAVE